MDIEKIIQNKRARNSRNKRPISAFIELFSSTDQALKEVAELGASKSTQETLAKSHVINIVTAVEVYYRDILDSVFRMCAPSSFMNKLSKLHDRTYKINNLVEMYENNIHPLELIANSHSFQNIKNIDKVFSLVVDKPFLKEVKNLEWRLKDRPDTESKVDQKDINALQELFEYRHLLIHNPNLSLTKSTEEIEAQINSAHGIILASDIILSNYISKNEDPVLTSK